MVSVSEMLWPARRPKLEGIEGVAAAIAADKPPSPVEIIAVLDAARCSDADLDRAVARHRRVAELRRTIAASAGDRRRFAVLDAEMTAAYAAIQRAVAARDALIERIGEEHATVRAAAEAADRATQALLSAENLPPVDAERLADAEAVFAAAAAAAVEARETLTRCRRSLEEAEVKLPLAVEDAKVMPLNQSLQAEAERLKVAVATRSTRVQEAAAALAAAEGAEAKAGKAVADVAAAIRRAVLA